MKVFELIDLLQKADPNAGVVIHDHFTDWALANFEVRRIAATGAIILSGGPDREPHMRGLRGAPYEVIK